MFDVQNKGASLVYTCDWSI